MFLLGACVLTKNIKSTLTNAGFCVLGAALAALLILGYFLFRDGGRSFWSVMLFAGSYSRSEIFSPQAWMIYLRVFLRYWWILFAAVIWFIYKQRERRFFYLSLLVLAFLSTYGAWSGQYYVILMPFLAIVSAQGLKDLIQRFSTDKKIQYLLALAVVFFVAWSAFKQSVAPPNEFEAKKLVDNPVFESPAVAERVAALTSPKDYVFIAGSEPQILYYARRRSPTRFITMYPLMLPSEFALGYQQEAVRDLAARPPKVIVMARSNLSWLLRDQSSKLFYNHLIDLTDRKYVLAGGYVWEGGRRYWQEPLSEDKLPLSSLLLFMRR